MATKQWKEQNQEKMKQYRKEYYHRNKESEKKRISERRKSLFLFIKQLKINDLKCIRCEEDHPATLQFHHRNPKEKFKEVSVMCTEGYALERIKEEINKCDVLCANCHFKEHYTDIV